MAPRRANLSFKGLLLQPLFLVDVSDILNFFLLGGGEGGVRGDREGRSRLSVENPTGGGVSQDGGRGPRGPGGCLQGILGGGLNIFFGAELPAKF